VTVADSSTPTLASGTAHLFVASITTNRNPTWYSTLPGVTHGQIAVGPTGKIRIAAEFNRNLILPLADGSVESFVPNAGSTDLLVAQLDPVSGAWNWARQFGGAAQDFATAIAIDADDFTTFAGTMGSSTPFGEVLLSATTPRGFLARIGSSGTMDYNAWTIGAPVPVPDAARRADGGAFSIPLVTIRQPAGAPWTDYFHWSPVDQRLYPIRPVAFAEIAWPIDATPTADRLSCPGRTLWPKEPTLHVAGVPTDLELATPDPAVELSRARLFGEPGNGDDGRRSGGSHAHSVPGHSNRLQHLALSGDPRSHRRPESPAGSLRSRAHAAMESSQPACQQRRRLRRPTLVGSAPRGSIRTSRVCASLRAPADIAGSRPAHDRANRRGPIVPVNRDHPTNPEDDLIVAWFRRSPHTGVPWPDLPVHYEIRWPDSASELVIASGKGSGPLPADQFPEKHIYSQPDTGAGGFNPNEEHALLVGDTLYALRSDLNELRSLSEPWVLLKFRSGADWNFKLWRVVAETAEFRFRYAGVAGSRLLPPEPLASSGTCLENRGVSGPVFKDYRGDLWAQAAGPRGSSAAAVVQFSYPLLDSFYFDLDGNGSSDVAPGSCVPWLDRLPGGTPGQGINVTFDLRWPSQVPTLQVGETLMDARNGLPAVQSFAQASILYDDGDPAGTNAQQSVVRLFDPLAERMVPLPSPFVVPSGLATVNDRGRLRFPDLPHALRSRLSIIPSPTQAWLVFSGNVDTSNAGDPLLLPNVITPLERERLQRLTSNAAFQSALDALFDLTRNPGRLDLDRNGSPDRAVLIGPRAIDHSTQPGRP
jgi:hypothetical protein